MSLNTLLEQRFRAAMSAAGIPDSLPTLIAPSKNPQFGDYQCNAAMGAAKQLGKNPREVAQAILDALEMDDMASDLSIAGPGFINVTLSLDWLGQTLTKQWQSDQLQIAKTNAPQTVVIDYSSPNLAKEMHVGHIRTTVIGDALARVLESLGHTVIRQNHVGDWGTQFGMLIAEMEQAMAAGDGADVQLKDLEGFYLQAKKHFDDDENFQNTAREYVVKLQGGDERILVLWQQFKGISLQHCEDIYRTLNVGLTPEHVRGESAYNDDLKNVIDDLLAKGIAVKDQGAVVVFLDEFTNKDGEPIPSIIQKSDGGYLYATTDLATIRYRVSQLKADRVLAVVDARQALHFNQVFSIARKAGYAPEHVSLEHLPFGTVLGKDGKPFKTRDGGTVKLAALLDEAVQRAADAVNNSEKSRDLPEEERAEIARKMGIGAIKYADLSKTRTQDYRFDWDSMLRLDGNTAPYMQYAYTRVMSIFRKAEINPHSVKREFSIKEAEEKLLAVSCLQFENTLQNVATEGYPHLLCNYLYDLAKQFMSFYEKCPILKEGVDEETRNSRLALAHHVAETIRIGLDLLGIEVMERM